MHDPASPARAVRFGVFELDLRSGELRKGPTRLKVPDQSIEILRAVLEQPGELVTREQLRDRLWPSNTFVDFEHGLNAAVRRLREALGDSADTPRFIETLPRRGYRFIGTMEGLSPSPSALDGTEQPTVDSVAPIGLGRFGRWKWTVGVLSAGALVAALAFVGWRARTDPPGTPSTPDVVRLTFDPGLQTEPTFSPDGRSIAYSSNKSGNFDIWQQPVGGGNAVRVTTEAAHDWQPDWSPTDNRIAFRSERGGGGIFVVSATGGDEQRITDFGYRPRWSPDGSRILFRAGSNLGGGPIHLVGPNGGPVRQIAVSEAESENTLQERDLLGADGWHPDGRVSVLSRLNDGVVRLVTFNPDNGAFKRSAVNGAVQQKFRDLGLSVLDDENLVWAPDRTALYFVGLQQSGRSPWMLTVDPRTQALTSGPHRLTTDTGPNPGLAVSRDGLRIAYAALTDNSRVWLFRLDAAGKQIVGVPQAVTPPLVHAPIADLTDDGTTLLYLARHQGTRDRPELRRLVLGDGRDDALLCNSSGGPTLR